MALKNELAKIFDAVRANEAEVIRIWKQRTQQEPWLRLPENALIDHVPDLLRAILDVVQGPADPGSARERVIRMSILHGRQRSENGFEDSILHHEHHLLRHAVWEVIRHHGPPEARFQAIARFDVMLTHTTSASLHGYHLERGSSPLTDDAVVDHMLSQDLPWPLP